MKNQARRGKRVWLSLFGLTLIMQSGCWSPQAVGELSYSEAKNELKMLVDEAVLPSLQTSARPLPEVGPDERCTEDSASSTKFASTYQYFFPISFLKNPDSFVAGTGTLWRSNGLLVEEDNKTPNVKSNFGVGRGFNLEVFVNYDSGMAYVGGSGPCLVPPSQEPA